MNDLWIVLHRHANGIDARLVSADHEPKDDEVIRACGIDFAPSAGETIETYLVDEGGITVLPAQKVK